MLRSGPEGDYLNSLPPEIEISQMAGPALTRKKYKKSNKLRCADVVAVALAICKTLHSKVYKIKIHIVYRSKGYIEAAQQTMIRKFCQICHIHMRMAVVCIRIINLASSREKVGVQVADFPDLWFSHF